MHGLYRRSHNEKQRDSRRAVIIESSYELPAIAAAAAATTAATAASIGGSSTGSAAAATTRLLRVAITAVYGTGTAGNEGNLSFLTAFGANRAVHFASGGTHSAASAGAGTKGAGTTVGEAATAAATSTTATLTGSAARGTALGFVGKTFGGMKLLLASGKDKGLLAINAS